MFEAGSRQQRQKFVYDDKESEREHYVDGCHPTAYLEFLLGFGMVAARHLLKGNVRGEFKSPEAQHHGISQRHYPANYRPSHPLSLLRRTLKHVGMRHHLSRLFANGD